MEPKDMHRFIDSKSVRDIHNACSILPFFVGILLIHAAIKISQLFHSANDVPKKVIVAHLNLK